PCDSAAAFTITSTSATTSPTSPASRMSPCTNESRGCEITSARFSRLPAYVSASSETTSYGVARSRWRTKFEEMKPAPPVTRMRLRLPGTAETYPLQLAVNRVERPALDPALNPAEILADQRQDETLDSEHVEQRD